MIWLIGDKGMLGAELSKLFRRSGALFKGTGREIDISSIEAVREFALQKRFSWIVNCAGYTAVDRAEDDVDDCYRVNRNGPENLGTLASETGATVIHISTDYVFDGTLSRPYTEDDPVSPLSVYGRSKTDGEAALLRACSRAFVIRTAWLYGALGPNFVLTMIRAMQEQKKIQVIDDQMGSPTYTGDLAAVIEMIVSAGSGNYGIYNYSNEGQTTWFQYALEILSLASYYGLVSRQCQITPISSAEFHARAKRPAYSVLSKEKIRKMFKVRIPAWQESLARFFCELTAS
jgi:dTDP-4-dehydrorhamnose reductase